MEVKIQIPDNCELIKDGDTYIVKEKKKQGPPKSWEEFCNRYPVKPEECYFGRRGEIYKAEELFSDFRRFNSDWCVSREEAKAFLALIQLRQLRTVWIGDWKQPDSNNTMAVIVYNKSKHLIKIDYGYFWRNSVLSFPTIEMAEDFLKCFRDLCETAKILL